MNAQLGPNASKLLGAANPGRSLVGQCHLQAVRGQIKRWLVVQAFHTRSVSDGLALY